MNKPRDIWDRGANLHAALVTHLSAGNEAWSQLDQMQKCELCCLLSFCCCFIGSLAAFPLATNLSIALLGLLACRKDGTEPQRVAFIFFCGVSTVTDIVFMSSVANGWGWGGVMTVINMVAKTVAATLAFRLCDTFRSLRETGGDSSAGLQVDSVRQRPLARADYHALAAEAVQRHSSQGDAIGDATHYRAI